MSKIETAEKKAARKAREAKQLARLTKARDKAVGKNYFFILIVALTIIYVVDEIASSMNSAMQPYVILDLFKIPNGDILSDEYAQAVAKSTVLSIPAYFCMILTPFYKSLADKYGRKMFLVINTTLMGAGLLVCMLSTNFYIYMLGILMVTFVQSNDMQVMYIMETAPAQHRAKLCSITKAIALVSVSLIGVFRQMFYDPSDLTSWRGVFMFPAIIGLTVGICCGFFTKETPVFLKERIEYLETSDEERAAGAKNEKEAQENEKKKNGGVFTAMKYIFTNKQLRSIAFAGIVFCIATGVTNYYSTIMEAAVGTGVITNDDVNTAVIFFPFINGLVTFFSGFFSDSMGRKKSCLVLSTFALVGLTGFVLGCRMGWNPYLIGGSYGLFIGGLWSVSDTIVLVMPSESTPTELRASVIGSLSMLMIVGTILSYALIIAGMNIVGSANTGLFCLMLTVPFLLVAMIMLSKNVSETKGADLSQIKE